MGESAVLITNEAVVLGMLALILGAVFYTEGSSHPFWKKFYSYVPALLMCYFLPSLLNTFDVVDGEASQLYYVSSRFLLPACLVLLTLSTDIPGVMKLGPKAVIMFLVGTLGIVIGGPIALWSTQMIAPEALARLGDGEAWRGMTTVAGSWIGGGANQAAMKEVFLVEDNLFGKMIAIDIIWANIWLAVLLVIAARSKQIDLRMGADVSAIETLKQRVEAFQAEHTRPLNLRDLMMIVAIGFGVTGFAHLFADGLTPWIEANAPGLERLSLTSKFFWIVVTATTVGLVLSFTRLRRLEGAGASRVGSALLYILIASIGLRMDLSQVFERDGWILLVIGGIWMAVHALVLIGVARAIRAPMFYMAVGSQANVGGAASAPVVASAFSPSLAPVGVLLAVLGYTLGTYMAWVCGQLLRLVAGG